MAGAKEANGSAQQPPPQGAASQLLQKRLRNARKRLRGIEEIQAKVYIGKGLNADQEAALQSKPGLVAVIEELERLASLMEEAVKEEVNLAKSAAAAAAREQAFAEAAEAVPEPTKTGEQWEREKREAVAKARKDEAAKARKEGHAAGKADGLAEGKASAAAAAKAEAEAVAAKAAEAAEAAAQRAASEAISSLIDLLYFSIVFDPFVPFSLERHACLTYAAHNEVALSSDDLDVIGFLGKLLTTRPYATIISHAEALEHCKELASRFVLHPQTLVSPANYHVTGAQVRTKLAAIKETHFFVVVPALQGGGPMSGPAPPAVAAAAPPAAVRGLMQPGEQGQTDPSAATPAAPVEETPATAAALSAEAPAAAHGKQVPTPEAAAASGQNLVNQFFRSGGSAPPPQQQQQQQQAAEERPVDAVGSAPEALQQPKAGPPSFAGDSGLGIEGVPIEQQEQEEAKAPQLPMSFAQVLSPARKPRPEGGAATAAGGSRGRGGGPPRPVSRGGSGRGGDGRGRGGGRGRGSSGDLPGVGTQQQRSGSADAAHGAGRGAGSGRGRGSNGDLSAMGGRSGNAEFVQRGGGRGVEGGRGRGGSFRGGRVDGRGRGRGPPGAAAPSRQPQPLQV